MDQESIVLDVDPRSVVAAIKQANQAVEGWEKGTVGAGERMQKSLERMAEMLLKVNDRSRSSMERLTQSIERQAAAYGKTGVERLVAERDRLIRKLGDEQWMVDRVTKAYEQMIKVERQREEGGAAAGGIEAFGKNIKGFIEEPLASAKEAASGLLEKIGPMGGAILGGAAALTAFAAAGWESAKSLAEYGLQIENAHLRTGLTVTEVGQFSYAARMAGQDVSVYERMMRGLSEAANESSEQGNKARAAMQKLGVEMRTATGDIKPTSQILIEISEGLSKLPEGMQRDAMAMELFKRVGIEAIPVISKLSENVARAKELGLGATDEDVRRWEQYHRNITEAEVVWERFVRKIKEPLAATIMFFFRDEHNRPLTIDDLKKMGVNVGKWDRNEADTWAAAEKAGFRKPQWMAQDERQRMLDYINKIDERRRADEAVNKYYGDKRLDPEYRLREAETALSKLEKPKVGVTSQKDLEEYRAAERKVTDLKALIEHTRVLHEEESKLAAFEKQMYQKDMDPVAKIFGQRDELAKSGADWNRATAAALYGVNVELGKQQDQQTKRWQELSQKAASENGKFWDKEWAEVYKGLAARAKQMIDDFKQRVADARAELAWSDEQAFGRMQAASSHAERVIGTLGQPGDELETLREQLAVRRAVRDQELAIKEQHAAIYDIDRERFNAEMQNLQDRYEYEDKILELKRKEFDEVERTAQSLAHTLLTKPAEFGKQLASTIHEAILKPITEGIGSLAARALTPLIYGSDGQAGIASIFKGVFGRQDPMKNAMDLNTTVTVQNSMAVAGLTAVMSAFIMGAPAMPTPTAAPGGLTPPAMAMPAADIGSLSMSLRPGVFALPNVGTPGAPAGAGGVGGGFIRAALGRGQQSRAGATGGWMSNLRASWNSMKAFAGFGNVTTDSQGGKWVTIANESVPLDSVGGYAQAIGHSPAAGMAGSMLAMQGLLGSGAGSWRGVIEGTAGGAMLGFQAGGPLGAAIGATLGFEIGAFEKLFGVESPENEAKRLVKQLYSINIDAQMAKQIVAIAQQKYAGHVSIAVRDPDVRKMLMLYSEGTGQKMPLSATTPQSASLAEMGGRLYQQATYVNGTPYTFQSNLPVLGGYATGTYPSPGPMTLQVNVQGQGAAQFVAGQVVTPEFVQAQWSSAAAGSNGRLQNSAVIQQPGLVIS